jgi:hypothetical protein
MLTRHVRRAAVTDDDLVVIAQWLVFAAGLAMIGYRLLTYRGARRRAPAPPKHHPRIEEAPPAGQSEPPGFGSASRNASR